ncbi:glycosyltransferase family 2 protein [Fischerella sp. JS2]|uniref:glycosyltransferase family 2 protein n=1 Tax=Fischerella sp. JS2 TaxID=2597771 RepID=UPI0028ECBFC5|nr:glycosyltransferase family 2 protein [Fischerella sp. JS2]
MVKNESDIIAQTLKSAVRWSDFIYVYDNGSTDGTWEKVIELAKDYKQIIPYKQDNQPFADSLRSEPFNYYRAKSVQGDWWCKLDADEIYIDNPRVFLSKIPKKYEVVWAASFEYYFTDKDLALYEQNPSLYADDVPVEEKCRYYINNWSEPRFFRYKESLVWEKSLAKNEAPMPSGSGESYNKRIRLKHFQYRSPQQIQKRIDTRIEAMKNGSFLHEKQKNWKGKIENCIDIDVKNFSYDKDYIPQSWKERVVEASKFLYDAHDGKYVINEEAIPKIPTSPSILSKSINRILRIPNQVKKIVLSF